MIFRLEKKKTMIFPDNKFTCSPQTPMLPTSPPLCHVAVGLCAACRRWGDVGALGDDGERPGLVLLTITVGPQDWPEVVENPSFPEICHRVSAPR